MAHKVTWRDVIKNPALIERIDRDRVGICSKCGKPTWARDGICRKCERHPNGKRK